MRSAFVCFFFAVAARADIAPDTFHGGTGLQLDAKDAASSKAVAKIQMKKERVTITLHHTAEGAFAVVDATFHMTAPSPTKLRVVFPGAGVKVGEQFAVHPTLVGFRAFVDGKPVAVKDDEQTHTTKGGPPGREYSKRRTETWHAFAAAVDDDTTIRVRYALSSSGVNDNGYASVSYILHTGALWAKDIEEAILSVEAAGGVDLARTSLRTMAMPPVSFVSLSSDQPPPPVMPAGAVRSGSAITFTATHLEPTDKDDVEVVFPSSAPSSWGAPSPALAALMLEAVR